MEQAYRTIAARGEATFTEKRSRFIGIATPITSEEQAASVIAATKKQYWDARHTVFAYQLRGGMVRRYADDGEPQGTAGIPMLEVLTKAGVEDCLITVTRYFGGILLGTGGLVRAYSHTAALALEAAGIAVMTPCRVGRILCGYPQYQPVATVAEAAGGEIIDRQFADDVTLTLRMQTTLCASFEKQLTELSAGRITVTWGDTVMCPVPAKKESDKF